MSVVDVGDALELTFTGVPGATVTVDWLDPDEVPAFSAASVTEAPVNSGQYPYTFLPTRSGLWTAWFFMTGPATENEKHYVFARSMADPPPLAVVGQVVDQFGPLTAAQDAQTRALLRAASKLVRGRFPGIDAMIADGTLDVEVVALGVTNMVLRVLRNPKGLRSETVGPFSRSFDTSSAAGELVITAAEEAMFTPTVEETGDSVIGSIMLRPGLAPPPTGLRRGWL